ncbi:presequence protease, mitochondrial-like [Rhagoletis pomonella]|uniref:presequence protease, mitochondrial-like n=1 Tax=Rhagoletis pomonella TaxID=28610 RepID=UPI0017854F85|nr:presequence protease, mitochondrial-like [Rhagoletis pomonella]XP_036345439.1 presequence protease, mitochondrial-like [Rhagoletis pomonella]
MLSRVSSTRSVAQMVKQVAGRCTVLNVGVGINARNIGSSLWSNKNKHAQPTSFLRRSKIMAVPHIIQQQEHKFNEGKQYHGFECIRVESVPEFGIMSYTFRHVGSGTELWYLDRKDSNNVFSINFRTTPFDSTGLPHILEHSVLCGSQKYPVRDPFFKMLNRSVATFMNAMTGPDYTMYPFSTMNETDFRNLQKIYLDAVFRPNLEYLDFLQEGWRLEHSNINDKSSEYVLKGVVYNEMKGAFSENGSVFSQNLLNNLLPDHTYGFVSGGNPLEIPKLTHKNLVDFHSKYYHPSNARIYTYGNFDLRRTLDYVNNEYMSKYNAIDNSYSRIPNQPRWDKPRNVHISSRFDNMGAPFEKQNQIGIALLMSDVTDTQETFVLHVLSELLVRGPNSSFYRSLIEPNFSGGYNQATGYDPQIKDTFFCVGLQDLRVEDFARVQELYDKTIKQVMSEGFELSHVESVLHNIELLLKHQSPQFGMGLLFNSTPLWNHDGDVVSSLRVSNMIANFRHNLAKDPKYLQHKVEQYFATNSHRLTLTMSPDDHYEDNFKTAELDLLKQKIMALDDKKRVEVYENGIKLDQAQKGHPNLEILPCLDLSDVQKMPKMPSIEVLRICSVPTQVCHVHTNDISYLKLHFNGANLNHDEVMLLPLFCDVINDMGTNNYNFREFDKLVLSKTAGIDFKLHFAENIYDSKSYLLGVYMTTHALDKNAAEMFELSTELLTKFKLEDTDRLSMLIDNYISNISVGIASSGHLYAMQSCAGLITNAAKLKSHLAGVEHIEFMKTYVKQNKTEEIRAKLKTLGQKLFVKNVMRCALNTSEEFYPSLTKYYEQFLENMPNDPQSKKNAEHSISLLEPSQQHFVMNIPVNYCAKAFFAVPYTHRDHPTLRVLAKLISAKYLLPVVREQNGAYGAGARIGSDGIFSFFSYRDPNSTKTLEAFNNTYNWLQEHNTELTEQALFEAKLGVLQQLDAPIAPGNVGIDFFLYGVSQEMFANYRARMLSTSVDELKQVVERYFKNEPAHFGSCLLGPENKDLEATTNLKWKVIS